MPEKEKKKHVSPRRPEDLWTCSSWLARELVSQYLQLRVLTQTDAVALYIASGVLEFGREQKSFYESPGKIAKALGLPKSFVKTYIDRLIEDGVITRTETTVDQRNERKWSIPGILPSPHAPAVSGVLNSTPETDDIAAGHNVYPEGATSCIQGEATSCSSTGATPCDLHLRESNKEKIKEQKNKEGESEKKPPYISRSSSFKKRSKTEIQIFLDSFPWEGYQLDSPDGLASCWAHLVEVWRTPSGAEAGNHKYSAAEIDPMEVPRAYMTLKQMRIYKTPETVRLWLEWFVRSGGLNKSDFITRFSKTWDDYVPIVSRAFVAELLQEESIWVKELNERYRREEGPGQALPRIEFHRNLGEEELQRLRDDFLISLPDADAIRDAVGAVPLDVDLEDDGEYIQWLGTLARAVPVLGPYSLVSDSRWQLDFIRMAREDFGGDMDAFANATRDYVVSIMEYHTRDCVAQDFASPRINCLVWRYYAEYFDLAPGIADAQADMAGEKAS